MLINGWDIKEANARQMSMVIDHHTVSSGSEWNQVPVFLKNTIGFKPVSVTLAVHGEDREAIIRNRSRILAKVMEPAELILDGYEHRFYGILSKHNSTERSMDRWHNLQLEFNCFEYGDDIIVSSGRARTFTIMNDGTLETPMRLEITPEAGAISITLTGICRDDATGKELPVTIQNLSSGKTVVLDGMTGLITQESISKIEDTDLWCLPSLKPGTNVITVDNDWMDIQITYQPRYM